MASNITSAAESSSQNNKTEVKSSPPSTKVSSCTVLFACTLCTAKFQSVPLLYSHYRTLHKGKLGVTASPEVAVETDRLAGGSGGSAALGKPRALSRKRKESDKEENANLISSPKGNDGGSGNDALSGDGVVKKRKATVMQKDVNRVEQSYPKTERDVGEITDDVTTVKSHRQECLANHEQGKNQSSRCRTDRGEVNAAVKESEKHTSNANMRDKTMASSTIVTKDGILIEKKKAPLVVVKEKNKSSLLVILQDMRNLQALPEGSTFLLRNSAGKQQKHVVVANVDVEIIERRNQEV